MKCQIFLRLLETKENSPLCGFISANRCYNLRSLNLKWGPTVPQIVGYKWKFLTLYVFIATKTYNLRNLWIWIETRIFLRLKVIRENSPVCRIFVQWNPTIWGINISFLMWSIEQLVSLMIGHWSQRLVSHTSSVCSFYHIQ